MKNTLWKFGLIGGCIMNVLFFLSIPLSGDPPNYNTMEILGYASILLAMLVVFFGIKSYRDRQLGGRLPFSKGFLMGVGISAVASAVLGLYVFIHIAWIDPQFEENYAVWEKQSIEASSATPEEKAVQIAKVDEMLEMTNGPFMQSLFMYGTVFVIGIVVSLISAAILKRDALRAEPALE